MSVYPEFIQSHNHAGTMQSLNENFPYKRVVVTGGAGFLGRFIVERLKACADTQVFVPRSADYNLIEASDIKRLYSDTHPDLVIHLAAVVGGIGANQRNPGKFFYENLMHYHLIGICGTAMASLAGMLQARGHHVTGSDQNVYPPMSTMLESLGINVFKGYDAGHLTPAPDCVVVGNAIPRGNPEVEETLNRKLLYCSQAELVKEEFIRGKHCLAVAGTHGKTTTTSIASWSNEPNSSAFICSRLRPYSRPRRKL